jgi:hypothetical protein
VSGNLRCTGARSRSRSAVFVERTRRLSGAWSNHRGGLCRRGPRSLARQEAAW